MTFRVVVQPSAELDIAAAGSWIQKESAEAAARWIDGLERAIDSLARSPQRCGLAPESDIFERPIRQLLFGRRRGVYRVLFEVRVREVHILHIRHGARRPVAPPETSE